MPEEVGVILDNLKFVKSYTFGDLKIYSGELILKNSKKILITTAWSGWGKVSAARATTRLLGSSHNGKKIDFIIFTGVAGGVDLNLKQWDVVISESVIQHDMDASPLFGRYVIPAIKNSKICADEEILERIYLSMRKKLEKKELKGFGKLFKGLIATGDMFISDKDKLKQLSEDIKGILAVEMEGASFAQVAVQEGFNWMVLRVISDQANEDAVDEFSDFLKKYKFISFELIKSFLDSLLDIDGFEK